MTFNKIGNMSRADLRHHRKFIYSALKSYAEETCMIMSITNELVPIRILESIRSTRIRLPKSIVPDCFIKMALEANRTKKHHFEFSQNHPDYIHISLINKPLILEGQGILFYFFRELLQHIKKMPRAEKNKPKLVAVASKKQAA